ncbi:MAG: bifunctional DNA primase/polymerase [Phycisphaerales bacterium]|nr:bifunctional DNA primase/polymerase [Phycisphaerales bacterium]
MIDDALRLIGHGWFVFPCKSRGKEPLTLHGFKDATNDPEMARRLWRQFPNANIGIACGASKLAVADIDPRNGGSLESLTRLFGPMPDTVQVRTGGGGLHLYFRTDGRPVRGRKLGPGLDLKADGGYVIAPPSIHESSARYSFIRAPEAVSSAPLPESIRRSDIEQAETAETIETAETAETAEQAEHGCAVSMSRMIALTLPNGPGQRNRCVFRFARMLKSDSRYADADAVQLRPFVQRWHRQALPFIRTKEFGETWSDFIHAWGRVEFPAANDVLVRARAEAMADPSELPPIVRSYGMDRIRLLVRFCRVLQRLAGGNGFFLSCATVERLLGIPSQTTCRWLKMLITDGVLVCTKPGTKFKAARYRYVPADASTGRAESDADGVSDDDD